MSTGASTYNSKQRGVWFITVLFASLGRVTDIQSDFCDTTDMRSSAAATMVSSFLEMWTLAMLLRLQSKLLPVWAAS